MKTLATAALLVTLSLLTAPVMAATQRIETWESSLAQNPFNGTADHTWTGDLSGFQITTATWPTSPNPDLVGNRSLRSLDLAATSTVVTVDPDGLNTSIENNWSFYVSGNSGEITSGREFWITLSSNSSSIANIEAGTISGYRIRLGDDPAAGGSTDALLLEKATGSGWSVIQNVSAGAATVNVNQGWNIAVRRAPNGTWTYGFTNGAAGLPVTLGNSIVDTSVTVGGFVGLSWTSSSTGATAFGIDNFAFTIPEPATAAMLGLLGLGWRERRLRA